METEEPIRYILTLRDPRKLRGLAVGLDDVWADLQNPFSLVYDEMLACGLAASVTTCLPTSVLTVGIESAGSCAEKAQLSVSGRFGNSKSGSSQRCLEDLLTKVVFPHLASEYDFQTERIGS